MHEAPAGWAVFYGQGLGDRVVGSETPRGKQQQHAGQVDRQCRSVEHALHLPDGHTHHLPGKPCAQCLPIEEAYEARAA